MGTPGWERGQMDRGTWELLALNGETWLGMGTDGQRAMVTPGPERGNLLGNGDRWAGGHGDSWLGGEEHGDMWSPMGSWTPGQLWGYLSRPGATVNAVTPLRQGTAGEHDHRHRWDPGSPPSGTHSRVAGATLRCQRGGGTDRLRGGQCPGPVQFPCSRSCPVETWPCGGCWRWGQPWGAAAAAPRWGRGSKGHSGPDAATLASCPWPMAAIRPSPLRP